MADSPEPAAGTSGKKKKKSKSKSTAAAEEETAFVFGGAPKVNSSTPSSPSLRLQSASYDQQAAASLGLGAAAAGGGYGVNRFLNPMHEGSGLDQFGGNRFLSAGLGGAGVAGGGVGYGATSAGTPFGGSAEDEYVGSNEYSSLLQQPVTATATLAATSAKSGASPSPQELLARFKAAKSGGSSALTPEQRKNIVGGLEGDKDSDKNRGICGTTNVVAGLILVVVLSIVGALGAVFYSRLAGGDTDDSSTVVIKKSDKPHVIFFLADDLGWNSIGYEDYDLSFATPFLTGLAKDGIIMNNYYAQEVCTPARAALLTGRYPLSTGMQYSMIMPTTSWGLSLNETLLSQVLKDAGGYKTHMLGKWHLGHYSPRLLPTARGFDSYTGYLSGENYYWSKKNPDHTNFVDMLTSDASCYAPYLEDDIHDYSTFLYRDKAIKHIEEHDESEPLFLYLAFQAVHDPFNDFNHHSKGLPKEYLSEGVYEAIGENVVGHKRRQYAMALSVMDDAISDIHEALDAKGILDNSYIVFSSDNGGCYLSGGKNGPLRGSKGSLFDGGLKVDGFIYSSNTDFIPTAQRGQIYNNLMHISDWFPSILDLAGVSYTAPPGLELDGTSHADAWLGKLASDADPPREYLLYNYYYAVTDYAFNKWANGSFAIRNAQYKLMHTYDSTAYGAWWDGDEELDNDDTLAESTCSQALAMTGEYTYYLFDLIADPYETTNLYHESGSDNYAAKTELYAALDELEANARFISVDVEDRNKVTPVVWKNHHDTIVPWVSREDLDSFTGAFPEDCYVPPTPAPTHAPDWTPDPTAEPSAPPTAKPNSIAPTPTVDFLALPSEEPTYKPTNAPTTHSPTTAVPTEAPTGGQDNIPTWFFTPTIDEPTLEMPTLEMPSLGPPSLITEPTCDGCPTTLPIVLDGPTWAPSASTPTFPTVDTTPTTPTWNWPTWAPVAPSEAPTAVPATETPTQEPTLEPSAEPTVEPTDKPTAEPTKKNDDDWYLDDAVAPTHEPTKEPDDDDWDDDSARKKRRTMLR